MMRVSSTMAMPDLTNSAFPAKGIELAETVESVWESNNSHNSVPKKANAFDWAIALLTKGNTEKTFAPDDLLACCGF
jgi:hypothetical protein